MSVPSNTYIFSNNIIYNIDTLLVANLSECFTLPSCHMRYWFNGYMEWNTFVVRPFVTRITFMKEVGVFSVWWWGELYILIRQNISLHVGKTTKHWLLQHTRFERSHLIKRSAEYHAPGRALFGHNRQISVILKLGVLCWIAKVDWCILRFPIILWDHCAFLATIHGLNVPCSQNWLENINI